MQDFQLDIMTNGGMEPQLLERVLQDERFLAGDVHTGYFGAR